MKIVADHRLQKLKHFQSRKQLATWRRAYGYDRDDGWMHGTRPLSPKEFTTNVWSELNALKDAISMPRQKVRNLISATERCKVSDDDFAMFKRLVEKRDHDAVHATIAAVDTAQYRSIRSMTPETSSDVCVHVEKKEAGMMDPGQDQLE